MKKFIIALMIFGSQYAFADFMAEPYLGYEFGSFDGGGTIKGDYKGLNYGARVGYSILGLKFGLDYMGASPKFDYDSSSTSDVTAKLTDIGLFAGYEFPILLQAYATYFIKSSASVPSDSPDYTGKGLRLGVGYTGLPFVVVNFEMITRTYDEHGSTAMTGGDLKVKGYALNVSLPIP